VEPALREVTAFPGVTAATGTADGAAFVFQGDKSVPIVVRGLDRESADPIYRITPRIVRGSAGLGGQAVAIGTTLAAKLRLQPGSPMRISLAGGASEVFTVAGIFDFEVEQLNESWVIMSRQRSAALFGYDGGVTSIEIQVRDVFAANRLAQRLRSNFPEFKWSSWMESNASLLAALQSQSSSSLMIQVMVIIAVALGISSVLAVSAVQKVRQIGILKALGSTTASISRIFLIQGGLLGLAGALLGCGIGAGLAYGFIYGTSMATGRPLFPLSITAGTYLTSMLIATGVGTVAAMAPARRSARLNPIEVIRNG